MTKHFGKIIYIAVPIILILAFAVVISVELKSCEPENYYYQGMSNHEEWVELVDYEGKPNKYLGHRPNDALSLLYSLNGLSEKEFVYAKGHSPIGFGNNEYTIILAAPEAEEPLKALNIKKLVIVQNYESSVSVEDKAVLNSLTDYLRCSGEAVPFTDSFMIDYNATVYFDVECDLTLSCALKVNDDRTVYLVYYNSKEYGYCFYDVTEVLGDII